MLHSWEEHAHSKLVRAVRSIVAESPAVNTDTIDSDAWRRALPIWKASLASLSVQLRKEELHWAKEALGTEGETISQERQVARSTFAQQKA